MFNESIQNIYRIFFDEWYTERRIATDQKYQIVIGLAQVINSPKYSICAHQTVDISDPPNKRQDISIFGDLNIRK